MGPFNFFRLSAPTLGSTYPYSDANYLRTTNRRQKPTILGYPFSPDLRNFIIEPSVREELSESFTAIMGKILNKRAYNPYKEHIAGLNWMGE